MLKILEDNSVELTRGDTARLTAIVTDDDDVEYKVQPEDKLTLSVKKSVKDTESLITKEIKGHNVFHIEPKDTSHLQFGTYKYDVQIDTAEGDTFTVIPPSKFTITQEVTC